MTGFLKVIPFTNVLITHFLSFSSISSVVRNCRFHSSSFTSTRTSVSVYASAFTPVLKTAISKRMLQQNDYSTTSTSTAIFTSTHSDSPVTNNNANTPIMEQKEVDTFASYLTSISTQINDITNSNANTSIHENANTRINIIMGNEAGDADSIISSLTLSYVKNIEKQCQKGNIDESDNGNDNLNYSLSLPLISINREDMPLRRDVILLLQMAGIINYNELIYLNDSTFNSVVNNVDENIDDKDLMKKTITLVDHNKIRSELWYLERHVHEILDHHQDENCHIDSVIRREVAFENQKALVGSTCTLVTERLMMCQSQYGKLAINKQIEAGLGLSLLGVILLDTMNMSPDAAKGTERDEKAIDYLMENTDWDNLSSDTKDQILMNQDEHPSQTQAQRLRGWPDRVKLYEFLRDSKFDRTFWNEMNARDALRIDYKRFEGKGSNHPFGLSSVLLDADKMTTKELFYDSAISYMKEVDVDILGVMCMVIVNDKPQRELVLIGKKNGTINTLTNYLLTDNTAAFLDISLKEEHCLDVGGELEDGFVVKRLFQGNPKGSRKQIAPVMLSFYSNSSL
jgi:exopolyphosphatase